MISNIQMHRAVMAIAAALFIQTAVPASAMEMQIVDSGLPLQVKLTGEIMPGDAERIIQLLKKAKPETEIAKLEEKAPSSTFDPRQWLWVDVESTGGDLEGSLKLGRYLRSANALITTKQVCASACVFLLAGAAERSGLAEAAGKIGIHRPYFTDARGRSQASLDVYFTDLHKELATYLEEMHVPTALADLMFATPPEQMRALTADELAVMFPLRDPAWDEVTIARRAGFNGMTSVAYRERQLQSLQNCVSAKGVVAKNLSDAGNCPLMPGMPVMIDEFAANGLLFSGRCANLDVVSDGGNGDFMACIKDDRKSMVTPTKVAGGHVVLLPGG